jgi:hypothetical protein
MQDEQQTCGKGLAAHAALPEKIGGLIQSMAELLQNHTRSLDLDDANARLERDAYDRLIKDERSIGVGRTPRYLERPAGLWEGVARCRTSSSEMGAKRTCRVSWKSTITMS